MSFLELKISIKQSSIACDEFNHYYYYLIYKIFRTIVLQL